MKKILVPMIEVGGGHRTIALAVKEAIDATYPGEYVVDVIDFAKEVGALREDKAMKDLWDFLLAHPKLTANMNSFIDSLRYLSRSNFVVRLFFQQFIRKGTRYIHEYKPDIVFSTHFFCASVALFAREKYNYQYKVISYVSDPITTHNLWVNPKVDVMVAATQEAKSHLTSMGMPKHRIKVASFPLNLKFFREVTKTNEQLLAEMELDSSFKTVLASSGGQGIGETGKYIKLLYEKGYPVNIIAVCGKNEELYKELNQLKKTKPSTTKMAVLGFVDNMHELLEATDLGLTKAGPSAIFEHLTKNIPPIITQLAGLQEKGNLEFCLNNKLGWHIKNEEEFLALFEQVIHSPVLEQYKENIKNNSFVQSLPQASYDLARFIIEELGKPKKKRQTRRNPNLRALFLGTRIGLNRMRNKSLRYRYDR